MTLLEKLAEARVQLQSMKLKKSGANKFAGYKYYELADFLPAVNEVCRDLKLCPLISFGEAEATMTIYDSETSQSFAITSQLAEAQTKGQLPIQAIGSTHTYIRRYLYMLAFEIVENDYIDSLPPQVVTPTIPTVTPRIVPSVPVSSATSTNDSVISDAVKNTLWEDAKAAGHKQADIKAILEVYGWTSMAQITNAKIYEIRQSLGLN